MRRGSILAAIGFITVVAGIAAAVYYFANKKGFNCCCFGKKHEDDDVIIVENSDDLGDFASPDTAEDTIPVNDNTNPAE
ncbi:hypothetical protein [Acetanaerobacterium elongatum]|uniref:Uncharacterized protein n=1 Tax=Acetanaerobacterium elongatum TaxID=258515 RepID=A0A1H0EQK7_9FIRM|nr:hypothetical protein [Acetanaerobacterium elongatum]SDN84589.1 hypothetical protein SAMN05192585_13516 [Acetanaerobacterium elongatum]